MYMYYVSNYPANKVINLIINNLKPFLSKRKFTQKRLEIYEKARKEKSSESHVKWENSYEENLNVACWDYTRRFFKYVLMLLSVVIFIIIPSFIKVNDNAIRSKAILQLSDNVQHNNRPESVQTLGNPSYVVTMPCNSSNKVTSTGGLAEQTVSCDMVSTNYSTKSMSTNTIQFLASSKNNNNFYLYGDLNPTVEYNFIVDTDTNYQFLINNAMNCVDSSQDSSNGSANPSEVMHVVINKNINLQTSLGNNQPFSICEWVGTEGTVQLTAQTFQSSGAVLTFEASTDTSHITNLLPDFTKFMVSAYQY